MDLAVYRTSNITHRKKNYFKWLENSTLYILSGIYYKEIKNYKEILNFPQLFYF